MKEFRAQDLPLSCPPIESCEQKFENIYRLVKSNSLTHEAFLSNLEEKPSRKPRKNQTLCSLNAISFFANLEEIKNLRNGIISFKKRKIAIGTIEPNFGVSKVDGSSHINLWAYKGVQIHTHFSILTEEEDNEVG